MSLLLVISPALEYTIAICVADSKKAASIERVAKLRNCVLSRHGKMKLDGAGSLVILSAATALTGLA